MNWDRNVWLSKRKGLEKAGRLEVVLRHIYARPIFPRYLSISFLFKRTLDFEFSTFEPPRRLVIGCEV